jgi:hypothetical protein
MPLARKHFCALCLSALIAPTLPAALAAPPVAAPAAPAAAPPLDPNQLIGTWKVDLRPTPNSVPYYQTFVIRSVKEGALQGRFYSTEIKEGRINKDWEHVHFAFTTSDGSGAYHTSGRLIKGRLEGTTHAVGRGFLSVWTAERVPAPKNPQGSGVPESRGDVPGRVGDAK